MQIEEKVMTQWGCNFCGDIQGGKSPSKAPALEFLIGPHDEKGNLLICDRCVAICHQKIAQLKVPPVSMNTASARVLSRRYRPLVFSVNRKVWRQDDAGMESADAEYKAKRPVVLAKGDDRCVFCGFRSKHTEVHHCNDDHTDNRDENLAIADPLCHGTQHIGQVGSQRHGVLIYFEDFPHAEFNHLQRTIAVALEIGSEAEKREALALLQHLDSHAEWIASAWGSAHPSDFANAL